MANVMLFIIGKAHVAIYAPVLGMKEDLHSINKQCSK
jgi:hypothetical protein